MIVTLARGDGAVEDAGQLGHVVLVEHEHGGDGRRGLAVVLALVAVEAPARELGGHVELTDLTLDGVELVQRLQEGRLARLVLADEAGDLVDADPARVVDALVVGDLGLDEPHARVLVSCPAASRAARVGLRFQ